jgi:hypothetical protein
MEKFPTYTLEEEIGLTFNLASEFPPDLHKASRFKRQGCFSLLGGTRFESRMNINAPE